MTEEEKKETVSAKEETEEVEPTAVLAEVLEEDEEEDLPEEKNMDHIKGVFNYTQKNGREYRVVFYHDRKNLVFRELGNGKVEFVGRFTDDAYDEENEAEMQKLGEQQLKRILADRLK
ncbi:MULTISPECIES: hypothetical protein [unclassified Exiguobacterium]|uniref:hypothetical protein n=1 Tax=unclassified Exiguobacterium TaxID=2644629 RepID=UPI00103E01B9|nr:MULTISPECIES: hypothetical protein [unclassified Exiguobacterium]TCI43264.1 hypothetical protein EVJ31_12325 [Exiguobacterium sp. SH5S32]TCI49985.1 hypothetical protein EVJ25_12830 [Exiguobacterium sp. SH1S4]TCI51496.1 hypothetical protein EVJ24_12965 [Exiguobacterium sp. SH1S21]TCI68386.1 hypothetical protein EVJ23_12315 [Exiguobacterium sp. SH1S1]TCI72302.1 hypothetical protein EVJ22_06485 [Exiguobacterium sp. SH0S7]